MNKPIFATVSWAAVLVGAWFTVAMVKPPASKAITAVEMPAWVFPVVTVQGSQVPMLCMNNMGDGSVRALIGLLDVADSSRAASPMAEVSLAAHQGTCRNLPVNRPAITTSAGQASAIAAIWIVGGGNNESGGGGGAGKSLVASVQVGDAGGTRFVLTPNFMQQLLVPAVAN